MTRTLHYPHLLVVLTRRVKLLFVLRSVRRLSVSLFPWGILWSYGYMLPVGWLTRQSTPTISWATRALLEG